MAVEGKQICFGAFAILRDSRELRRNGLRLKLEDQPLAVLLALLENPGTVVTRSELQARLWPDGTFVDFDKSLTKAVNKIRTALNDSAATPRYIETVSRHGYRFIAPVSTTVEPLQTAVEPVALKPTSPRRTWAFTGVAGLLMGLTLAGGLYFAFVSRRRAASQEVPPIQSLAVLPIANLTGDSGQDYFADGLTDDLISDLSRIGSLRVISYTSSMHYRFTRKSLPEIARELSVDGVVEGSVQRSGGRIRMNVKLVRAALDRQLWSESYEGDFDQAALLQGRIARAVAHQISAHLTAEATARLSGGRTPKPRAYDLYLHGRYLWNIRGPEAVTQAADYFQQAVREDPAFALGWSGLADSYSIDWGAKYDPGLAEKCARKALVLDPALAEAHASLGFALDCLYRFAEAEKELKRAIEMNSNYVAAHQFYAVYLLTVGRLAEALAENDRALHLDPFSFPVNNLRGFILVGLRQYDRAVQQMHNASQIDPQTGDPQAQLSRIFWIEQKGAEALAAERQVAFMESGRGSADLLRRQKEVETVFARSGLRLACLRSVQLKEEYLMQPYWEIPLQYGLLRDKQKVIEWLDRFTPQKRYGAIILLSTAPELDFLRSDLQFQERLRRLGLPPK